MLKGLIREDRLETLSPEARDEVVKALREYDRKLEHDRLSLYFPHEKQRIYHAFTTPIKLGSGGNQTIRADTLVRMADGAMKPIADIRPGDGVVGVNLDGTTRACEVLKLHEHGKLPLAQWNFREGSIAATADHKVLVKSQRKVWVKPLSRLAAGDGLNRVGAYEPTGLDRHDEEFALLFGLLLGDGSMFTDSKGQRHCYFYHSEPNVIELARAEAQRLGLTWRTSRPNYHAITLGRSQDRFTHWWYDKLAEHGLWHPAREKTIPDAARGWSNEGIAKLLAGLYMTDGWVTVDGTATSCGIQLTSQRMVEQMNELLRERLGIYPAAQIMRREYDDPNHNDAFTLKISNRGALRTLQETLPMVGRKGKALEAAVEGWDSPGQDSAVVRPRDVEGVGEDWTFDLEIDHPTHLFALANGLVVSNSGKTTMTQADNLIQALDEADLPSHLKPYKKFEPPFLCRIMGPSFSVLQNVIFQKLQELIPPHTLLGGKWSSAFDKQTQVLHFANGSRFFFLTYEMDVAKMGGASVHRVSYDEEPPLAVRNECRIRVMAKEGDECFAQTPVEGLTWSFDGLWTPTVTEQYEVKKDVWVSPDVSIVRVDMDDNPALTAEAKRLSLAGLSAEERQARKEGRYVALHGLIYADFRRSTHIVPDLNRLPEFTNVVVGIDPGIRHPAGVVWAYFDVEDRMVCFDEIRMEGRTAAQVCEQIHIKNAYWNVKPIFYVIDPSARNKEHITGRNQQMEYADHGIVTIAGQNDVRAGINRIKERIESDRFYITTRCPLLANEFERYRWKAPPRTGEDGPEKPVKTEDDLVDPTRYIAMARPYLPDRTEPSNETELEKMVREDQERGDNQDLDHEFGGGVFC